MTSASKYLKVIIIFQLQLHSDIFDLSTEASDFHHLFSRRRLTTSAAAADETRVSQIDTEYLLHSDEIETRARLTQQRPFLITFTTKPPLLGADPTPYWLQTSTHWERLSKRVVDQVTLSYEVGTTTLLASVVMTTDSIILHVAKFKLKDILGLCVHRSASDLHTFILHHNDNTTSCSSRC
ncbi:uncharacterized protein V6R79_006837 [Siganus canaliculatus]